MYRKALKRLFKKLPNATGWPDDLRRSKKNLHIPIVKDGCSPFLECLDMFLNFGLKWEFNLEKQKRILRYLFFCKNLQLVIVESMILSIGRLKIQTMKSLPQNLEYVLTYSLKVLFTLMLKSFNF